MYDPLFDLFKDEDGPRPYFVLIRSWSLFRPNSVPSSSGPRPVWIWKIRPRSSQGPIGTRTVLGRPVPRTPAYNPIRAYLIFIKIEWVPNHKLNSKYFIWGET